LPVIWAKNAGYCWFCGPFLVKMTHSLFSVFSSQFLIPGLMTNNSLPRSFYGQNKAEKERVSQPKQSYIAGFYKNC
jgi:hypothetical protein